MVASDVGVPGAGHGDRPVARGGAGADQPGPPHRAGGRRGLRTQTGGLAGPGLVLATSMEQAAPGGVVASAVTGLPWPVDWIPTPVRPPVSAVLIERCIPRPAPVVPGSGMPRRTEGKRMRVTRLAEAAAGSSRLPKEVELMERSERGAHRVGGLGRVLTALLRQARTWRAGPRVPPGRVRRTGVSAARAARSRRAGRPAAGQAAGGC